jgi:hypothetical protein
MKLISLLQLHAALTQLSGSVTHLVEGKALQVAFRFTGLTRLAIAKAIRSLAGHVADHKAAVSEIVKQHGGPWGEPCEEHAKAIAEIHTLEQAEVADAPTFSLPLSEFTHDDNPVSPAVLEVLLDHLE